MFEVWVKQVTNAGQTTIDWMSEEWMNTGRVQTILLFKFCAVALLALIGWFPAVWTKLSIIVPAYVVRTAVMDSAFPLQKSILMDYVSKVRPMPG